ncbi:MAG: cupin domain-containing protein [Ferruginibacter sp.]
METGKPVSVKNAEHYKWGQSNDGWHLLKTANLSVIEECMFAGNAEGLHFHKKAEQLFYILSGEAVFETGKDIYYLSRGESVHVLPGIVHKISNNGPSELHFIVISSPAAHGDRIDV